MGSSETIVVVDSVSKDFSREDRNTIHTAVANVSFTVEKGEIVCIVGETGCGKSTVMNMLLGLEKATTGSIILNGLSPAEDFLALRGTVAAVFQTDRLLPWRTVIDNAALGLEVGGLPGAQRRMVAAQWLGRLGLEGWENAYPSQLSGGMRQRVAIARAFAVNPIVILLDEAFGHLDEVTAERVRRDCIELIRETRKTAVVITHNIGEALDIGDTVIVFSKPARVVGLYRLATLRSSNQWEKSRDTLRAEVLAKIEQTSHQGKGDIAI